MYHTASVMYNSYNVGNGVRNVHVDGRGAIIGGYLSCSIVAGGVYVNAYGYCHVDNVSVFNQSTFANRGASLHNNTERYIPFCNGFTIYSQINTYAPGGGYVNLKNTYGNATLNVVYYTVNS